MILSSYIKKPISLCKGFAQISLFLFIYSAKVYASNEPEVVVKKTTNDIYEVLKTYDIKSIELNSSNALIEEKITPNFELIRMNRMVLGKNWSNSSQTQQDNFAYQFRRLFIRTYAKALSNYKNQSIEYLPTESSLASNIATVKTRMVNSKGTVLTNYNLVSTTDGWKIYDVVVDNVSLVMNYRSQFSTEIRQSGIDALNNKLAEKNGTVGDKITSVSQSFTAIPVASNSTNTNTNSSQSNNYSAPSEPDPLFDIISGVTGIVVQNKINHDAKHQRDQVAQQQAYQQAQQEQQRNADYQAQLNTQRAQQTKVNTEIYVGSTSTSDSNNNSNSGNSKQEATQCLRQAITNNGSNGLQNICSKKVSLSYCDIGETGHSLILCGKEIGAKFIVPGEVEAWNSSSQRQYYIGCFFPYYPQHTKWNGQNLHADFCG